MGNPIRGFPTKKTVTQDCFFSPPAFFKAKGDFALCGARHGDAVPVTPASLCKGLTETFILFATSFSIRCNCRHGQNRDGSLCGIIFYSYTKNYSAGT